METFNKSINNKRFGIQFTSNGLKLIAIVAMLLDHIAVTFFTHGTIIYILLRFFGRFTAPIMFYQAVEGYHHTRNRNRYILRMALFALISYIPFIYFSTGTLPNSSNFYNFNVMYTIFLGLLAIKAKDEIKNPIIKIFSIGILLILSLMGDLAYLCIIMMLAMDFYRGNYKNQAFAYLLIVMGISQLLLLFLEPFTALIYQHRFDTSALWQNFHSFGLLVPIAILGLYNGEKGKGGSAAKWGFYIFYPLHMLILGIIKNILL